MESKDITPDQMWAMAAYAAKQPRGSLLWKSIVNRMIHDLETMLDFYSILGDN